MAKSVEIQAAFGVRFKLRAEGDKLYAAGGKLYAEGGKLRAEGGKLCAEGGKLRAEGDLVFSVAVIAAFGAKAIIEWWRKDGSVFVNDEEYSS